MTEPKRMTTEQVKDLTRRLTTEVGELHIKFKADKLTWEDMNTQAQILEDNYLKKVGLL